MTRPRIPAMTSGGASCLTCPGCSPLTGAAKTSTATPLTAACMRFGSERAWVTWSALALSVSNSSVPEKGWWAM